MIRTIIILLVSFFSFYNCSPKVTRINEETHISNIVFNANNLDGKFQIIKQDVPSYPTIARKSGMEGTVVIKAIVGFDGTVDNTIIAYSSHKNFNEAALKTSKKIKFKPGQVSGKKVRFYAYIPFMFWLKPSMANKVHKNVNEELVKSASYEKNNQNLNALENYDKVIKIINNYSRQLLEWSEVYEAKYSVEELSAIKINSTIFNRDMAKVFYRKGKIYTKQDKYDLAIDSYKTAISLDSSIYSAYGSLGWTYYLNNNFEKCIEYSEKMILYNPTALFAHYNIGLALLNLGLFKEATDKYQSTTEFAKKYYLKISKGVYKDLKDVIEKDIHKEEANRILVNIFALSEQEIVEL